MTDATSVLVVEDDAELAGLYASWTPPEWCVETVPTGEDAVPAVDDATDVVVLDRRLPGRSGDEVLTRLRDAGYDCQVVIVTAVDPDFDVVEMRFDDYLVKPVDRDDVRDTVSDLLSIATYADDVQEYFALAKKRATVEGSTPTRDLAADDRYQDLVERTEALKARVDETFEALDDEAQTGAFNQFPDGD